MFYPAPIIFKGSGFYVTDSRKRGDFSGNGGDGAGKSDGGQEKTSVGKDSDGASE